LFQAAESRTDRIDPTATLQTASMRRLEQSIRQGLVALRIGRPRSGTGARAHVVLRQAERLLDQLGPLEMKEHTLHVKVGECVQGVRYGEVGLDAARQLG